jgi:hypothetical protein
MKNLTKPLILGFILALIYLPPLHAQTEGGTSGDTRPSPASRTTPGQAPDEVMKKLSNLVHAGNYVEAQQLTVGLLLAYPDDQRLIKAKALLDKSLATAGTASVTPDGNLPVDNVASAPPAASTRGEPLAGLDKVDFNALIELARQAQQSTDLSQQTKLLRQFLDQSSSFLQKHPDNLLLWQLRAASAMSLDDLMSGYEAGQKLLALGAADSTDPNLQHMLAQLRNKSWLGEEGARRIKKQEEETQKYASILGRWSASSSLYDGNFLFVHWTESPVGTVEFSLMDSVVSGYVSGANGVKDENPSLTITLLDKGKLRCEFKQQPVRACGFSNHNKQLFFTINDKLSWILSRN